MTQSSPESIIAEARNALHSFVPGESESLPELCARVALQHHNQTQTILSLREQLEAMRANYTSARELVAKMHAAAVGEISGPRRGVVEDVEDLRQRALRAESELAIHGAVPIWFVAKESAVQAEPGMGLALSFYLGERCRYCERVFQTVSDLVNAVWAGPHPSGQLACKSCWETNGPHDSASS